MQYTVKHHGKMPTLTFSGLKNNKIPSDFSWITASFSFSAKNVCISNFYEKLFAWKLVSFNHVRASYCMRSLQAFFAIFKMRKSIASSTSKWFIVMTRKWIFFFLSIKRASISPLDRYKENDRTINQNVYKISFFVLKVNKFINKNISSIYWY